jgi:hypothetical protein
MSVTSLGSMLAYGNILGQQVISGQTFTSYDGTTTANNQVIIYTPGSSARPRIVSGSMYLVFMYNSVTGGGQAQMFMATYYGTNGYYYLPQTMVTTLGASGVNLSFVNHPGYSPYVTCSASNTPYTIVQFGYLA